MWHSMPCQVKLFRNFEVQESFTINYHVSVTSLCTVSVKHLVSTRSSSNTRTSAVVSRKADSPKPYEQQYHQQSHVI